MVVSGFEYLYMRQVYFYSRWVNEWLLLEWILQSMVRHFVTHKQVQADKGHPI